MLSEADARLVALLGRRQAVLPEKPYTTLTPGAALATEQQAAAALRARLANEEANTRRLLLENAQLKEQLIAERRRTRSAERSRSELTRAVVEKITEVDEAMSAVSSENAIKSHARWIRACSAVAVLHNVGPSSARARTPTTD